MLVSAFAVGISEFPLGDGVIIGRGPTKFGQKRGCEFYWCPAGSIRLAALAHGGPAIAGKARNRARDDRK